MKKYFHSKLWATLLMIFTLCLCQPRVFGQGYIEVYPINFDYGDVIVGQDATMVVTAQNIGDGVAVLWEITLTDTSGMFEFRTTLYPPIELAPMGEDNDSQDIVVAFMPKAEGYFDAYVTIDTLESLGVANLDGTGIAAIIRAIADLINLLDLNVVSLTIQGSGPNAASQAAHVNVFRNLLSQAEAFEATNDIDDACNKLQKAYIRSDGLSIPKDYIQGSGVAELNNMIAEVMINLNCGSSQARLGKPEMVMGELLAYPNPASDQVDIEFTLEESQRVRLEVFDFQGRMLESLYDDMIKGEQKNSFVFNASEQAEGLYLLVLTTESGTLTKRLAIVGS